MATERELQLHGKLSRNVKILAVFTVLLLALLAIAPAQSYFTEWRSVQKTYNERAEAAGSAPVAIGIKQIWRPEIHLIDRCTSCHLGMGAATPLADGGPLFGAHPSIHHNVSQMGCTICHRGQGQATTQQAAHGNVKHWEDPMLERELLQSSCGRCHGRSTPSRDPALVERGEYLFELNGCKACHVVDGDGGMVGPELTGVGLKGYSHDWQEQHLRAPTQVVAGSRMMSFGHLADDEVDVIVSYLDTLIGAPTLSRGKAVAVREGCRGCHKIDGVGGDHGPDLNDSAEKLAVDRDFSGVTGAHTIENWQRTHLRFPNRVSPNSKMPRYLLSDTDETALVTYLLSLRTADISLELLPPQAALVTLAKTRDFDGEDGKTLFSIFCSACHGADGGGQVMASLGTTVPAITNPDMLMVASDDYLYEVLRRGRPGRDMPAWVGPSGLTEAEATALVTFIRSAQKDAPAFPEVLAANGKVELGAQIFGHDCAGCHGVGGDGTEIGPSVRNPEFRIIVTADYLYETITNGRRNTAMPAHRDYGAVELASLIAYLGSGDEQPEAVVGGVKAVGREAVLAAIAGLLFVDRLESYKATGSPAYGKTLFTQLCVGCHGEAGLGGLGPAIGNPYFLSTASDGLIAGSMILGRGERGMRAFGPSGIAALTVGEVGDIITYLRAESRQRPARLGERRVQGIRPNGKDLFAQLCVGCHGENGEGRTAPALNNQGFLDSATDGFLQATIARGRRNTSMRGWAVGGYGFAELKATEINDIVAYIRSWQQPLPTP